MSTGEPGLQCISSGIEKCWPIRWACNGFPTCDNNYEELCNNGLCDCSQQDGSCSNNITDEKRDGMTWCPVNGKNTCVRDPCDSDSRCDAGWKEKCNNKDGFCYHPDSGWKKQGIYDNIHEKLKVFDGWHV